MKKTRLFFLSFVMVITITMLSGCGKDKTDNATAETTAPTLETMSAETTTAPMSDEEWLAKFSSMVESEVEKQLSATTEQTSAHVVEETVVSTTETATEAKETEPEVDAFDLYKESFPDTSLIKATALHKGKEYKLYVEPEVYMSAFYSRFLSGHDRSFEILLETELDITTVYIWPLFRGADDDIQNDMFCDYSVDPVKELTFEETDSGYSFSYEIPDNPYGVKYGSREAFVAVFGIVDADGNIYCTSISY